MESKIKEGKRYVATHPLVEGRATVLLKELSEFHGGEAVATVEVEEGSLTTRHRTYDVGQSLSIALFGESRWELQPTAP